MPLPPDLPQELVDHIVRFLFKDKRALQACTHVCRRWLHTSRSHLFYQLNVFTSQWYFGLPTFLVTLQNYPNIIYYVKALKIAKHALAGPLPSGGAYQHSIDARIVTEVLSVMVNLHTLIIEDLRLYEQVPWEASLPVSSQPRRSQFQLKKLIINHCLLCVERLPSPKVQALLSLLDAFDGIEELSIKRTTLWEVPHPINAPISQTPGRPLRIRYLSVEFGSYSPSSTFLETLLEVLDPSYLRSITFRCESNEDAGNIGSFLSHTPNLRRLHIDVGCIWGHEGEPSYLDGERKLIDIVCELFLKSFFFQVYDQTVWAKLNVSSCTSLQSLVIDFSLSRIESAHGRDLASWDTVFSILSTAPPSLRSISLVGTFIHRPYGDWLHIRFELGHLRTLLYRIPLLDSVLFKLTEWPRTQMPVCGEQIVRRELGWLDERGILKVPSTDRVYPYVAVPVVPTRSSRPGVLFRWLAKLSHRRVS